MSMVDVWFNFGCGLISLVWFWWLLLVWIFSTHNFCNLRPSLRTKCLSLIVPLTSISPLYLALEWAFGSSSCHNSLFFLSCFLASKIYFSGLLLFLPSWFDNTFLDAFWYLMIDWFGILIDLPVITIPFLCWGSIFLLRLVPRLRRENTSYSFATFALPLLLIHIVPFISPSFQVTSSYASLQSSYFKSSSSKYILHIFYSSLLHLSFLSSPVIDSLIQVIFQMIFFYELT